MKLARNLTCLLAAATLGAGLLAPAAFAAPTRDELETQALDHANKANDQVGIGVDAFKAGDSTKGCAAFRIAYNELGTAIDLLNQDADTVRADKTLSDDARNAAVADVTGARDNAVNTRNLVSDQITKRCS
jgi:hypothetical protein